MTSQMQNAILGLRLAIAACVVSLVFACATQDDSDKPALPIESVEQAKKMLNNYHGKPEKFVLAIDYSKALTLNGREVPKDAAMAVIADLILSKGWMPNGFEEHGSVRYYQYSK